MSKSWTCMDCGKDLEVHRRIMYENPEGTKRYCGSCGRARVNKGEKLDSYEYSEPARNAPGEHIDTCDFCGKDYSCNKIRHDRLICPRCLGREYRIGGLDTTGVANAPLIQEERVAIGKDLFGSVKNEKALAQEDYKGYTIKAVKDPNFGGIRCEVWVNGHATLITQTLHSSPESAIHEGKRRIDTGDGIRW